MSADKAAPHPESGQLMALTEVVLTASARASRLLAVGASERVAAILVAAAVVMQEHEPAPGVTDPRQAFLEICANAWDGVVQAHVDFDADQAAEAKRAAS